MPELKKKDSVYYARILEKTGTYDVCDLTIRTVSDTWFVGEDRTDKHAYLFHMHDIGKIVFLNRQDALDLVLKTESEKPKQKFTIDSK